ncbi:hypothetical protein HPULCUR_002762 [Helicostylum pulchrum]|uniref:Uncharacterized protein n=1 Tax=Helicostylum pulchrum TaxID=562976 RepID=A0ABP9XT40_9FUNG
MVESSRSEYNVDFLSYLKSRFKDSSAEPFTKLRCPTLLLIHNQLTIYLKLLARLKEIWEEQQEVLSRFEAEVVGFGEPFEESVEDYISNNEA